MKIRVSTRWPAGLLACLLLSAAATAALVRSEAAPATEPADDFATPAEAPRNPIVTDADLKRGDGTRRREESSRRARVDESRSTRQDSVPARAQPSPTTQAAPEVAMAQRLFETVRAPIGTIVGNGGGGGNDEMAARAAQTAQRRNEMAAASLSSESRGLPGPGNDGPVMSTIRTVRETLREPFAWLLIVLLAGIVLTLSYLVRRSR